SPNGVATTTLTNTGTLTKSAGVGTATFGSITCPFYCYTGVVTLNNSGTVNVQAGTLQLNGFSTTGTSTGLFQADAGATLEFVGGTHTLSAASSVSGAGDLLVSGGSVNVDGAINVANANVAAGTATINGSYNVSGTTTVSGGIANFNAGAAHTTSTLDLS